MKNAFNIFMAVAFVMLSGGATLAQTSKEDKRAGQIAELKRIVDGKNFVFTATAAQPTNTGGIQLRGGATLPNSIANQLNSGIINLTSTYDVKLSNDTLTAFLPYYGQAYSAPIYAADGGIKLKTDKFDYTVKEKKKGNLQITIKPKEVNMRTPADVFRMILSVSPGGYASLQVTAVNRSPITFTGTLEEIKSQPTDKI